MNKKIITIGIIVMFLIVILSTLSAVGMITKKSEVEADEEIDLKVTVKNIRVRFTRNLFFRKIIGYEANVFIKNIGNAPLRMSEYPIFEVQYTAEYAGEEVCKYRSNWWKHPRTGFSLEPGETTVHSVVWGTYSNPIPQGSILTIFVDPNNLIPEIDDIDNNYWSEVGSTSVGGLFKFRGRQNNY